jgi:putative transposase
MVGSSLELRTWIRKQLEEADSDLLRELVAEMTEALMSAEADSACNAAFGERSPARINSRNGYRPGAGTPGSPPSSWPSPS